MSPETQALHQKYRNTKAAFRDAESKLVQALLAEAEFQVGDVVVLIEPSVMRPEVRRVGQVRSRKADPVDGLVTYELAPATSKGFHPRNVLERTAPRLNQRLERYRD